MPSSLDNLEEAIRKLQDMYDDPDIVIPASQLPPKENPYKAFEDRNPYGEGGITELTRGPEKGKFHIRIGAGDNRKTFVGTKAYVERQVKLFKENQAKQKIPSNKLTTNQKKTVLQWGKNKSKALGETWSDKKTLQEYNDSSEDMRQKIRSGDVTGTGGSWAEGQIKPLTKEQQKLWDATMADEVGKWEDYPEVDRNRWRKDFPRKQKIYSQTKDLLNIDELAEFLGKEFNTDISRNKIKGRFSSEGRTALGQYINDNLFVDTFGSIKGNIEGEIRGNVSYYKKPTKTQINQIRKQNLVFDTRTNTLRPKTIENIKTLHNLYGDSYRSGAIPKLEDMMDATGLSEGQIAKAEARLAQIYNGHKFRNGPEDIRVNKNAANKLFNFMSKSQFGNPRKNELYNISLDLIDEGLGNEKNTFSNLKDKARNILKENGIKLYSTKSPGGFNIDELAGVTGSAKSKNMAVSQFINIIEGNLNQTTLQNFQSSLSRARSAVEAAKDTPRYDLVLKKQMDKINTRAATLENQFGIKLARLERPENVNKMTSKEINRLKNIPLGTGESLYERLVKDAKTSGYSIKFPKGTATIQEFVQDEKIQKRLIDNIINNSKLDECRLDKADGGRIGFKFSTKCIQDGLEETKKKAAAGDQKAARQLVETAEAASKGGRLIKNVLGPGAILGEALFEGALIGNRLLEGKPLKQAWAQSYLSYLDPRKYSGELDPTLLQREQMLESTADKDILRSGFAAQDQLSAFNKALLDRDLAKARGRTDQYLPAAADAREQGRLADQSADIISSEAFKDASNIAQEYIQGQEGQRMLPFNQFKQSIGRFESGEDRDYRRRKEQEMKNLYTQYSDDEVKSFLKESLGTDDDKLIDKYLELTGVTKRITPAVTTTLSGLDVLRTGDQIQQAIQRVADAGGVANLAGGGIAKLAGIDQGPPPVSGPNPQGLQGLLNRVKKQ